MIGCKKNQLRHRMRLISISCAAAVSGIAVSPVARGNTLEEFQFTGNSFNPTTLAANLTGSAFGYVNANPGYPPFQAPFIVQGGILPDDPAWFVGQSGWIPTTIGNEDYYDFSVSVAPGFVLNASSLSEFVNSRQQVGYFSQIEYSTNANFSSPTNFDTTAFAVPTAEVWTTLTASDAPISGGVGTYYFRIYNELDPNGSGTISDLLNSGNITLTGTVAADANATPMYWDPGNSGAPGSGGAGTWTGGTVWADGAIDYAYSTTIAETPNFAGPVGGTVAVGGLTSALYGINFSTAGYVITGSASQTLTVAGTISAAADATISASLTTPGAGVLTKTGAATLTIAGPANLASGTSIIVNQGTLAITTGGSVTANGATQEIAGNSASLLVQGTGSFSTDNSLTIGDQTGSGTLTVQDSATLNAATLYVGRSGGTGVVNQNGGVVTTSSVVLGGATNSFGTYFLNAGTLLTTSVSGAGGTSNFAFNGGILQASAPSSNFISGVTNLQVEGGGAVIDTNGNNVTITESISAGASGSGGLTKNGTGTLVLSAAPTYTGATTVDAGTLQLPGDLVLPASSAHIATGAVLQYSDVGNTYQGPITYTGTGTLQKTGSGNLVFGAFGSVNVDFSPGALIDIQGGQLTGSSSYGGVWTANQASLNIASGATFNAVESGLANTMQIDALTGGGIFLGGYFTNPQGGLTTVTIGVAGGSGTFSGSLHDNSGARLGIIKTGAGTETLSGTNTNSGPTAVNQGLLVIGNKASLPDAPVNLSGTGTLQLAQSIGGVMVPSLSISSFGQLDIENNHILIQYGGNADPIASIRGYIMSGYASGLWTGPGIISGIARANGANYGIGYADSADPGNPASLASGTIDIQYTLLGDADLNGIVNGIDLGIVAANFNKGVTSWDQGDFDYNGVVNGVDFGDLAANFNKGASGISANVSPADWAALYSFAAANGLLADVPEPTSGAIVLIATAGAILRRRRHSSEK